MSTDTITITTPLNTSEIRRVVFNGNEHILDRCAKLVFTVLPDEVPILEIQYLPEEIE
jgi:hypothetical protein